MSACQWKAGIVSGRRPKTASSRAAGVLRTGAGPTSGTSPAYTAPPNASASSCAPSAPGTSAATAFATAMPLPGRLAQFMLIDFVGQIS